uniref:Tudor domain-containing protein n=2 Tax=Mesocestoides corti TaxID=53468 RepID=A0A5K3F1E6_MESCO
MAFLKRTCSWIPCLLSKEVQVKFLLPLEIRSDLNEVFRRAVDACKRLEVFSRLVCEHSGLHMLAVRLTNIHSRYLSGELSGTEICRLKGDLDRCEAEVVLEILSCAKQNHVFLDSVLSGLQKDITAARQALDNVKQVQEPLSPDIMEKFNSTSSTFEALLIGWFLQSTASPDPHLSPLVQRLEKEVSASLRNPTFAQLCVPVLEQFFSYIPSPKYPEASSLHHILYILGDVARRLDIAVKLIERTAFLITFSSSKPLQILRFAYPRAKKAIDLCLKALEGVVFEVAEWRTLILHTKNVDVVDGGTQAVVEAVNFAMDVLSQESPHTSSIGFYNCPDLLNQTLACLATASTSLLSFREVTDQFKNEKTGIFDHTNALLQEIVEIDWLLADTRLQTEFELANEIGGVEGGEIESSWSSKAAELLQQIKPANRRRLLNMLEDLERSASKHSRSLLALLDASCTPSASFEAAPLLDYIVARAESFVSTEGDLRAYPKRHHRENGGGKSVEVNGLQPNGHQQQNSPSTEAFYAAVRNLSNEFTQIRENWTRNPDRLKLKEVLRRSEILVETGRQSILSSRRTTFCQRIVFSHWPEALKMLILAEEARHEVAVLKTSNSPLSKVVHCALDFQTVVAHHLMPSNLGLEEVLGSEQPSVEDAFKTLQKAVEAVTCGESRNSPTETNGLSADESWLFQIGISRRKNEAAAKIWQFCSDLYSLFQDYNSQVVSQVDSLASPSMAAIRKDLTRLDLQLTELARGNASLDTLEDCSRQIVDLERLLQKARETARILFTCIATDSRSLPRASPANPLDVDELYKRAVKLVRDYQSSEIGCQLVDAWQHLQLIADKLGRLQAGLPLTDSLPDTEPAFEESPMPSSSDFYCDEVSSASLARRRGWSLLEVLGSHDCLYPGCRRKSATNHNERTITNSTLLSELQQFYDLLFTEFNECVMNIPEHVLTSTSVEATNGEMTLMNLREEWHKDKGLSSLYHTLRRRVEEDVSGDAGVKNTFIHIQTLWGDVDAKKGCITSDRLATVSSWLLEVQRQLEKEILPRLQSVWKFSDAFTPLSTVEECVYKMSEITEDSESLARLGLLSENRAASVNRALRTGWFSVREFLVERCVKSAVHEDLCGRYFTLIDDYIRLSAGLGFVNDSLVDAHTKLCNQFLLRGSQRRTHDVGHSKLCSTRRSLRSLFLPSWLTEKYRMVNARPPVAVTLHSLPDVSTGSYPTLCHPELAFHSPVCASLQSRCWTSTPDVRVVPANHDGCSHRRRAENSFSEVEDASALASPQMLLEFSFSPRITKAPHWPQLSASQLSFSAMASEDGKVEIDEHGIPSLEGTKCEKQVLLDALLDDAEKPSELMKDVSLLLSQLRAHGIQALDVEQAQDDESAPALLEPNESSNSISTSLGQNESIQETGLEINKAANREINKVAFVSSRKYRTTSPISWCTIYLPTAENVEPPMHLESTTESNICRIESSPVTPQREFCAPAVCSALPDDDNQSQLAWNGGKIVTEEKGRGIEQSQGNYFEAGMPDKDDPGTSDWLGYQQEAHIQELINEYMDGDDDTSLTEAESASSATGPSVLVSKNQSGTSASFEESGLGDDVSSGRDYGESNLMVVNQANFPSQFNRPPSDFHGDEVTRQANLPAGTSIEWGCPQSLVLSEAANTDFNFDWMVSAVEEQRNNARKDEASRIWKQCDSSSRVLTLTCDGGIEEIILPKTIFGSNSSPALGDNQTVGKSPIDDDFAPELRLEQAETKFLEKPRPGEQRGSDRQKTPSKTSDLISVTQDEMKAEHRPDGSYQKLEKNKQNETTEDLSKNKDILNKDEEITQVRIGASKEASAREDGRGMTGEKDEAPQVDDSEWSTKKGKRRKKKTPKTKQKARYVEGEGEAASDMDLDGLVRTEVHELDGQQKSDVGGVSVNDSSAFTFGLDEEVAVVNLEEEKEVEEPPSDGRSALEDLVEEENEDFGDWSTTIGKSKRKPRPKHESGSVDSEEEATHGTSVESEKSAPADELGKEEDDTLNAEEEVGEPQFEEEFTVDDLVEVNEPKVEEERKDSEWSTKRIKSKKRRKPKTTQKAGYLENDEDVEQVPVVESVTASKMPSDGLLSTKAHEYDGEKFGVENDAVMASNASAFGLGEDDFVVNLREQEDVEEVPSGERSTLKDSVKVNEPEVEEARVKMEADEEVDKPQSGQKSTLDDLAEMNEPEVARLKEESPKSNAAEWWTITEKSKMTKNPWTNQNALSVEKEEEAAQGTLVKSVSVGGMAFSGMVVTEAQGVDGGVRLDVADVPAGGLGKEDNAMANVESEKVGQLQSEKKSTLEGLVAANESQVEGENDEIPLSAWSELSTEAVRIKMPLKSRTRQQAGFVEREEEALESTPVESLTVGEMALEGLVETEAQEFEGEDRCDVDDVPLSKTSGPVGGTGAEDTTMVTVKVEKGVDLDEVGESQSGEKSTLDDLLEADKSDLMKTNESMMEDLKEEVPQSDSSEWSTKRGKRKNKKKRPKTQQKARSVESEKVAAQHTPEDDVTASEIAIIKLDRVEARKFDGEEISAGTQTSESSVCVGEGDRTVVNVEEEEEVGKPQSPEQRTLDDLVGVNELEVKEYKEAMPQADVSECSAKTVSVMHDEDSPQCIPVEMVSNEMMLTGTHERPDVAEVPPSETSASAGTVGGEGHAISDVDKDVYEVELKEFDEPLSGEKTTLDDLMETNQSEVEEARVEAPQSDASEWSTGTGMGKKKESMTKLKEGSVESEEEAVLGTKVENVLTSEMTFNQMVRSEPHEFHGIERPTDDDAWVTQPNASTIAFGIVNRAMMNMEEKAEVELEEAPGTSSGEKDTLDDLIDPTKSEVEDENAEFPQMDRSEWSMWREKRNLSKKHERKHKAVSLEGDEEALQGTLVDTMSVSEMVFDGMFGTEAYEADGEVKLRAGDFKLTEARVSAVGVGEEDNRMLNAEAKENVEVGEVGAPQSEKKNPPDDQVAVNESEVGEDQEETPQSDGGEWSTKRGKGRKTKKRRTKQDDVFVDNDVKAAQNTLMEFATASEMTSDCPMETEAPEFRGQQKPDVEYVELTETSVCGVRNDQEDNEVVNVEEEVGEVELEEVNEPPSGGKITLDDQVVVDEYVVDEMKEEIPQTDVGEWSTVTGMSKISKEPTTEDKIVPVEREEEADQGPPIDFRVGEEHNAVVNVEEEENVESEEVGQLQSEKTSTLEGLVAANESQVEGENDEIHPPAWSELSTEAVMIKMPLKPRTRQKAGSVEREEEALESTPVESVIVGETTLEGLVETEAQEFEGEDRCDVDDVPLSKKSGPVGRIDEEDTTTANVIVEDELKASESVMEDLKEEIRQSDSSEWSTKRGRRKNKKKRPKTQQKVRSLESGEEAVRGTPLDAATTSEMAVDGLVSEEGHKLDATERHNVLEEMQVTKNIASLVGVGEKESTLANVEAEEDSGLQSPEQRTLDDLVGTNELAEEEEKEEISKSDGSEWSTRTGTNKKNPRTQQKAGSVRCAEEPAQDATVARETASQKAFDGMVGTAAHEFDGEDRHDVDKMPVSETSAHVDGVGEGEDAMACFEKKAVESHEIGEPRSREKRTPHDTVITNESKVDVSQSDGGEWLRGKGKSRKKKKNPATRFVESAEESAKSSILSGERVFNELVGMQTREFVRGVRQAVEDAPVSETRDSAITFDEESNTMANVKEEENVELEEVGEQQSEGKMTRDDFVVDEVKKETLQSIESELLTRAMVKTKLSTKQKPLSVGGEEEAFKGTLLECGTAGDVALDGRFRTDAHVFDGPERPDVFEDMRTTSSIESALGVDEEDDVEEKDEIKVRRSGEKSTLDDQVVSNEPELEDTKEEMSQSDGSEWLTKRGRRKRSPKTQQKEGAMEIEEEAMEGDPVMNVSFSKMSFDEIVITEAHQFDEREKQMTETTASAVGVGEEDSKMTDVEEEAGEPLSGGKSTSDALVEANEPEVEEAKEEMPQSEVVEGSMGRRKTRKTKKPRKTQRAGSGENDKEVAQDALVEIVTASKMAMNGLVRNDSPEFRGQERLDVECVQFTATTAFGGILDQKNNAMVNVEEVEEEVELEKEETSQGNASESSTLEGENKVTRNQTAESVETNDEMMRREAQEFDREEKHDVDDVSKSKTNTPDGGVDEEDSAMLDEEEEKEFGESEAEEKNESPQSDVGAWSTRMEESGKQRARSVGSDEEAAQGTPVENEFNGQERSDVDETKVTESSALEFGLGEEENEMVNVEEEVDEVESEEVGERHSGEKCSLDDLVAANEPEVVKAKVEMPQSDCSERSTRREMSTEKKPRTRPTLGNMSRVVVSAGTSQPISALGVVTSGLIRASCETARSEDDVSPHPLSNSRAIDTSDKHMSEEDLPELIGAEFVNPRGADEEANSSTLSSPLTIQPTEGYQTVESTTSPGEGDDSSGSSPEIIRHEEVESYVPPPSFSPTPPPPPPSSFSRCAQTTQTVVSSRQFSPMLEIATCQTAVPSPVCGLRQERKPERSRPRRLLPFLLLIAFLLLPLLVLFCVISPHLCPLPGPCPGLTLRQIINSYLNQYHRYKPPPK